MADLGIDGRGGATKGVDPPPHRRSGGRAPSGGAGAEPPVGGLGAKPPQKLKPKNTLEASQKALW